MPTIKKIKSNPFNLEKYIGELDKEVSDLMILNQSSSPNISSFILQTEKLFGLILDKKVDKIDIIRQYVQGMCENILQKDNLNIIKENKNKIMKVLQEDFWENITFEDVEFIIKELSPLMRYFEPNPRKVIQIDAPDLVLSREKFEKEIKEDIELKKFLEKNPLINKIKRGDGINSYELLELEKELSALRPELTIESIQRYQKRDFLLFLREIIGLTYEYDPKELIEQRFDKFIMTNHFNSKQIEFLRLMKKVFADRKHIDIADLAKHPFDEEQPLEYFKIEELKLIVNKCNRIKMK